MMRHSSRLHSHFFACEYHTQALAQNLDSMIQISRRIVHNHYASILAECNVEPIRSHLVPIGSFVPDDCPQRTCRCLSRDGFELTTRRTSLLRLRKVS
ncbi:hypothetical protein CONLIGDRAFT_263215 [Coniochaeta ligniaria NRRL 30616]|uniref:Uncharacterized protein n=1 Tax=Coniochaeta ligniaria NRRL 30616 TaxID=1408157 RepID=A0A1J7JFY7_9PEZI|nr:hypothetical protein CONLIGDRAFT_263215 [Coniochaeta ligniaria NRRL 30616]